MSEDFELDIEGLIAPFAGSAPTGIDPRQDVSAQSLYQRLLNARAEARDLERQIDGGEGDAHEIPKRWRIVRDLSLRVLRERAKDLEVAAWLTEVLVREAGLAGLTMGATVIARLIATYWDAGLFPTPEGDDIGSRITPISGLTGLSGDGTLARPIRKQVFFELQDKSVLTFWQFFQSETVEGIADAARKKAQLDASQRAGVPPFATIERDARAAANADHFAALRDEVDRAILAWSGMAALLDEKAGERAPATGRVSRLLEELLKAVMRFAPARAEPLPAAVETQAELEADPKAAATAPAPARAVTREDMLRDLARIADFFRRFEPQSPLSLTLDEAIRRARLTWSELLEEVVANQEVRDTMLLQLGIKPKKEEPHSK